MMFHADFTIKFVIKNSPLRKGLILPLRRGEIPYGGVALIQGEDVKFLAGINHNTPFVFIHGITIMYGINSLQGIALVRTVLSSGIFLRNSFVQKYSYTPVSLGEYKFFSASFYQE